MRLSKNLKKGNFRMGMNSIHQTLMRPAPHWYCGVWNQGKSWPCTRERMLWHRFPHDGFAEIRHNRVRVSGSSYRKLSTSIHGTIA